jgi:hypothetical protein
MWIEKDCTFKHEGKEFTAGGAAITDDYLVAYPNKGGVLSGWHGNPIGVWRTISGHPAIFFGRRSWQGSTYYYMRATLDDGRVYSLRGFGAGMVARGKRMKTVSRAG